MEGGGGKLRCEPTNQKTILCQFPDPLPSVPFVMAEELGSALSGMDLFDLAELEGLPTYWRKGETLATGEMFALQSKKQPYRRTRERQIFVWSSTAVYYDFVTRRHCIATGRILTEWFWITRGAYAKWFAPLQHLGDDLGVFQLHDNYDVLDFIDNLRRDHRGYPFGHKLLVEFYDLTSVPWLRLPQPPEFMTPWKSENDIKPELLTMAFHHYGDRAHSHLRVGRPSVWQRKGLEFADSEPEVPDGIRTLAEEFTILGEIRCWPRVSLPETPRPDALAAADYDVRGALSEVDSSGLVYDVRQLALS